MNYQDDESTSDKERRARKAAKKKMKFFRHASSYLIIMAFLYIVNRWTSPGYQWWLWPALGWGIGLASHFVKTFAFSGSSLEERLVQKELDKMDDLDY